MLLYQILTFTTHEKIKPKSYKNNRFKVFGLTWNEKSELHDGSNSVSDIKDYFKYAIKKQETVTDDPPIIIYVNQIEHFIKNQI